MDIVISTFETDEEKLYYIGQKNYTEWSMTRQKKPRKYRREGDKHGRQVKSTMFNENLNRRKENGEEEISEGVSWDFLRTNKRHKSRFKELNKSQPGLIKEIHMQTHNNCTKWKW